MALFWFLIGLAIIVCIGRYNESNKLFWTLLLSFVGSFTVASVAVSVLHNDKSKESMNQVCPMQGSVSTSSNGNIAYLADELTNTKATAKLAGKDNTPEHNTFLTEGSSSDEIHTVELPKPPWYDNIF